MPYDVRAFNTTCELLGVPLRMRADAHFCTMAQSRRHSTLVNSLGRRKAFRNDELYHHLYGHPCTRWARLHDASDDVRVTALNYLGGVREGWW